MRVLLVSHRFPPDGTGGVERYTQTLASELVQAGDSAAVLTRRPDSHLRRPEVRREQLPNGTTVYRITGGHVSSTRFLECHEDLERLFTVAMLEAVPEVVHINHFLGLSPEFVRIAHSLGAAVTLSLHDFFVSCPRVHLQKPSGALCKGPRYGRECATTCHGGLQPGDALPWGLRALYFRKLLAAADAVIAYSDYVADYFRSVSDAAPNIQVIPNGVPWKNGIEISRKPREGPLRIAYCGTVAPHKGVSVLLEALRIAALPAVELLIVGDAPEREYAARLRHTANSIPGISLKRYGNYEPTELPIILNGTDIVVVPSLVPEAGPIVPREAQALGIPTLVSNLGALPELVKSGENGFLFNPNRPAELAGLLRRLDIDRLLLLKLHEGASRSTQIAVGTHARLVRRVYEQSLEHFRNPNKPAASQREIRFLHGELVKLGFASSASTASS